MHFWVNGAVVWQEYHKDIQHRDEEMTDEQTQGNANNQVDDEIKF